MISELQDLSEKPTMNDHDQTYDRLEAGHKYLPSQRDGSPSKLPRKPKKYEESWKTSLYLVGINMTVLGIDMIASAGFTYIPPILLKTGYSESSMSVMMAVGPLISFFVVPAIGRSGDMSQFVGSRRLPCIFALSILMVFSLLVIPYSQGLGEKLGLGIVASKIVIGLGVVLFDFTTQALMNPCKAWVSDVTMNCNFTSNRFTIFSCMFSLGSCLGYYISWIDWSKDGLGINVGSQEKTIFLMLAVLFVVFFVISLCTVKYAFHSEVINSKCCYESDPLICSQNGHLGKSENNHSVEDKSKMKGRLVKTPQSILQHICSQFWNSILFYCNLPPELYKLFIATLFGWMAVHCHDIYFTDFVGKVIFQGHPDGDSTLYDEGVRWGSWALFLQCVAAAVYAGCLQTPLEKAVGQKLTFLFGMSTFTLSTLCMAVSYHPVALQIASLVSGFGFAAVTAIPYDIVTAYQEQPQKYYSKSSHGLIRGIGEDMAVLDAASYVAQILPLLFLGILVDLFDTASIYIIVSSLCGAFCCYYSLHVKYTDR